MSRLRVRLTATLAIVAALTAVAVAVASYLLVRQVRLDRATDDAIAQSEFNLAFAAESLPPSSGSRDVEELLQALQRRGDFQILAVRDGRTFQTSVSLSLASIPPDLRAAVEAGRVVAARRTVDGRNTVVVGGALQPEGTEFWFFFPLDAVFDDLESLGRVLAASALAMVVLSGIVGAIAAGGLLRPIGRARDAARRLEQGELETRLPGEGSDEFGELSRSFNAMAAALERTVGELRTAESGHRRFVADVSHELRTPVTALAAAADVLEPRVDDLAETDRRAARVLVDEARRLRQLVEDLMEISRLDAGAATVERDLIDLRRLIVGTVAAHGWDDRVRVDDLERVVVDGDRRRLDRVFTNLVDNALRHGEPPVEIAATVTDGEVAVVVRDHGPGIAEEHLPKVFERFYKADAARSRSSSSGLGLAIAHENVALHGGRLEVTNAAGGGARFTVTLPVAVAEPLPDGDEAVTAAPDDDVIPDVTSKGSPQ